MCNNIYTGVSPITLQTSPRAKSDTIIRKMAKPYVCVFPPKNTWLCNNDGNCTNLNEVGESHVESRWETKGKFLAVDLFKSDELESIILLMFWEWCWIGNDRREALPGALWYYRYWWCQTFDWRLLSVLLPLSMLLWNPPTGCWELCLSAAIMTSQLYMCKGKSVAMAEYYNIHDKETE